MIYAKTLNWTNNGGVLCLSLLFSGLRLVSFSRWRSVKVFQFLEYDSIPTLEYRHDPRTIDVRLFTDSSQIL